MESPYCLIRAEDIERLNSTTVAVTRSMKLHNMSYRRSPGPRSPHKRTRVTTRCTVHNVRHWSAVSLPARALPASAGIGESQEGRIVFPLSPHTSGRTPFPSTAVACAPVSIFSLSGGSGNENSGVLGKCMSVFVQGRIIPRKLTISIRSSTIWRLVFAMELSISTWMLSSVSPEYRYFATNRARSLFLLPRRTTRCVPSEVVWRILLSSFCSSRNGMLSKDR